MSTGPDQMLALLAASGLVAPTLPPATGLGSDLDCMTDLTPDMREVSGRTCLAQAFARRLITPRGTLVDDPNYGYDVSQELQDDLSPADVARIASQVSAEAVKDERIIRCDATAQLTPAGVLIITATIRDGSGPFKLTLAVSDVTVTLLQVQGAT